MAVKSKKKKKARKERRYGDAKKQAAKAAQGFEFTSITVPSDANLFNPKKAGTYRLELIPYEAGEGNPNADEGVLWYERTYYTHRGLDGSKNHHVCPAVTFNKKCPACELIAKMSRDPDADADEVKDLRPKKRQLFNVFDHAEPEKGVQLWEYSYHNFGKQLLAKIKNADEDDGYENFFHEGKDGFTIKVGFAEESSGAGTFLKAEDIEFKARKKPLDDELLEAAHPLDDLVKEMSYKELKSLLESGPDDDEDDEDEKPKKGKKGDKLKGGKKGKTKKEEEDEDDDEDSGDSGIMLGVKVEYDGDEYTVNKISKDGKKVDLEDEDEEVTKGIKVSEVTVLEDDDEDEEEEKPKKGKGKKGKKSSKDDDDEDEDDEDDEDEDDEDEDDEDDDDDDDDDDDEKPKKGKKGKKKSSKEKKKGKGKKKSKDDDDDEDFDLEDEDDDW